MAKVPPPFVVHAMEGLRARLGGIQRKVVPPAIAALDFTAGMWSFQIVYTLCELGVPDLLGDTPVTAAALATAVGAPEDRLYRLLRAASNAGVVREAPGRAFVATPLGAALRADALGSARDMILFQGRCGWAHWGVLPDVIRSGKSAIELVHGRLPFDYLVDSEHAETFNRAMTGISAMAIESILAAYPFARSRRIADIGGGHGRMLGTILQRHPEARGVLFDLPSVVAGAGAVLEELGVAARCEVLAGDFFAPLPAIDADLFMMKAIIHDWPDDQAARILRRVRERMRRDSLLVLCEMIVPGPNEASLGKYVDIEMLVHAGGKERTEAEFTALLAQADLRLRRVIPTAGPTWLLEIEPTS